MSTLQPLLILLPYHGNVKVVRNTSDDSKTEILDLLAQLNGLVTGDTVGELIAQINDKLPKSGGTITGNLSVPAPSEVEHAVNKGYVDTITVEITLPFSGWAGDTAPYAQTISVQGLTNGRRCMVHPAYGDDVDANLAMQQAAGCISYAKRDGQNVTFTCLEDKPEVDISVDVEVYV